MARSLGLMLGLFVLCRQRLSLVKKEKKESQDDMTKASLTFKSEAVLSIYAFRWTSVLLELALPLCN